MAEDCATPHLDLELDGDNVKKDLAKILDIVRPSWTADKVIMQNKSDGLLNRNYLCHVGDLSNGFFLRIVNEKISGSLHRNIVILKCLQNEGLCPRLLCTFENGLAMELIHGSAVNPLKSRVLLKDHNLKSVAQELVKYHCRSTLGTNIPDYDESEDFFFAEPVQNRIKEAYSDGTVPSNMLSRLPSFEFIMKTREEIYNELEQSGTEKCLCHGDLNPGNLILTGDEKRPIRFIDLECCRVEYAVMEIAYFFVLLRSFCFWSGARDVEKFLKYYLEAKHSLQHGNDGSVDITNEDIKSYKALVDKAELFVYLKLIYCIIYSKSVSHQNISRAYWLYATKCYDNFKKYYPRVMGQEEDIYDNSWWRCVVM